MIEYKTVTLTNYPQLMSDWNRVLTKYGKEGWEYVMHELVDDDQSLAHVMQLLLKRKIK